VSCETTLSSLCQSLPTRDNDEDITPCLVHSPRHEPCHPSLSSRRGFLRSSSYDCSPCQWRSRRRRHNRLARKTGPRECSGLNARGPGLSCFTDKLCGFFRSKSNTVLFDNWIQGINGRIKKGTTAMKGRISDIASSCPKTKIVLLGYSQGAGVIGNVLCGGGGEPNMGPMTPPIADSVGNHGE
jgi:hypothetical protein